MPQRQAEPERPDQERKRKSQRGLVGRGEIGEDAGGKQHRDPKRPAILLGFEETRRGVEDRRHEPSTDRRAALVFARDPHGRCPEPAETASPCPYPASTPMLHHGPPTP